MRSGDKVITRGQETRDAGRAQRRRGAATSSAVRSGELKSTPAKPLTWRSTKPGEGRPWLAAGASPPCAAAATPPAGRGRRSCSGASARIEAGASGVTGPSRQRATASALRASGTTQTISRASRIWRIEIEIARSAPLQGAKPALADLLPPARLVQRHDQVRVSRVEVGRRIVEGEVAVLADADEGDSRSARSGVRAHFPNRLGRSASRHRGSGTARSPSAA